MNTNSNHYRIIDATELADLVFWTTHCKSIPDVISHLHGPIINSLFESFYQKTLSYGPINNQEEIEWAKISELKPEPPIIVRFALDSSSRYISFIYIMEASVELHIPELFFFSGDEILDQFRLTEINVFSLSLAGALCLEWQGIEHGGIDYPYSAAMWANYEKALRFKVVTEQLGG